MKEYLLSFVVVRFEIQLCFPRLKIIHWNERIDYFDTAFQENAVSNVLCRKLKYLK